MSRGCLLPLASPGIVLCTSPPSHYHSHLVGLFSSAVASTSTSPRALCSNQLLPQLQNRVIARSSGPGAAGAGAAAAEGAAAAAAAAGKGATGTAAAAGTGVAAAAGVAAAGAEGSNTMAAVTRRAWVISKTGDIKNMQLAEEVLPPLARGELRIAVKACGANFADVFTALGLYSASPTRGFVPGLEFSGVVEAVGADDAPAESPQYSTPAVAAAAAAAAGGFKPGDRVMGVTRFGAFASHVNIPAHQVRRIPDDWSFAQGAASLVQGLTAIYGLVNLGCLQKGDHVLVQSAAGGVGLQAMAICAALGAVPYAVVGSASKVATIREHCPDVPPERIIVRGPAAGFGGQLRGALAASGRGEDDGYDIVFDAVAGDYFKPQWDALARGGTYVVFGAADMMPAGDTVGWLKLAWQWLRRPRVDALSLPSDNKGIHGFNLIWMFDKVNMLSSLADELQRLDLPPPLVGETFAFEDAPDALRRFQSGATVGKVVLELD